MKIQKKDIMLLFAFVGILAAVAVYVWVYLPTIEKTEALEAENTQHASYVAQLEQWEAQVPTFQEETVKMVADVNEIFTHFPAESRAQDAIMYAVELEAQDPNTYISAIGISQPAVAYEAQPTTIKLNDTMEEGERTYRLQSQQISYTQQFSYDGMKRYVNAIVNDNDRRSIETLNLAFDATTGILVGNTTMNLYTLTGTDKVYQETMIPSMPMGTDNIFSTIEIVIDNGEPVVEDVSVAD
uniref:hypothetical protein n=1 Tax=Acetatifactor sp. TaxID=1872090 RepID=UPI0040568F7D